MPDASSAVPTCYAYRSASDVTGGLGYPRGGGARRSKPGSVAAPREADSVSRISWQGPLAKTTDSVRARVDKSGDGERLSEIS